MDVSTPPEIPGFRLLHSIGSGAYGVVWLGQDVVLGVYRAIKVVWLVHDSDRTQAERDARKHQAERVLRGLQEYLQRVSVLSFPAIAVLELKVDPTGRFFHYTMPLADDSRTGRELNPLEQPIEGYSPRTLSSVCAEQSAGHLPAKLVVRIGTRLAEALVELHETGIVHQDIKPSNIIFLRGDPTFADVDLVRDLDATRTIAGTRGYAAPEGSGSIAADLYSLGKTLFVLATGESPDQRLLMPSGDWDRAPDSDILLGLFQVWSKACEDNPHSRHASAAELRDELQLIAAGHGIQQIRRLKRFKRVSLRATILLTPTLIGLGALLLWSLVQGRQQSFELYRSVMARAVTHVSEGRLGLARNTLWEPRALSQGRGPEWNALWHQSKGDPSTVLKALSTKVEKLSFSPDGTAMLAEIETNLCVLDVAGLKKTLLIHPFNTFSGWLDNRHFVGTIQTGDSKPVMVWDLDNWKNPVQVFGGVNRLAGSPSSDGTFSFVNTANSAGIAMVTFPDIGNIRWRACATASPDHWDLSPLVDAHHQVLVQHIESGDGDTFSTEFHFQSLTDRWPPSRREFRNLDVQAKAVSPGGEYFAFSEAKSGSLTVLSGRGLSKSQSAAFPVIHALAFSPDGSRLASGGADEQLRILDPRTLEVLRTFQGHGRTIRSLAWRKDGARLASGDDSGVVRVWDTTSPKASFDSVKGLKAGGLPVRIVVSDTGDFIAVSTTNRSVAIVDAHDLHVVRVLAQGHTPVWCTGNLVWMLNGETNALVRHDKLSGSTEYYHVSGGSGDILGMTTSGRFAILHDRANNVLFTSLPPTQDLHFRSKHSGSQITDVVISKDGRKAATVGNERLDIWDVQSSTRIHTIHIDRTLFSVAFDETSNRLFVGCNGGIACLFDAESGKDEGTISTLIDDNFDILTLGDSDRIVSAGSSGKVTFSKRGLRRGLVVLEHPELLQRKGEHRIRRLAYNPVLKDLYAMTDGGILARWRMAPVEPE